VYGAVHTVERFHPLANEWTTIGTITDTERWDDFEALHLPSGEILVYGFYDDHPGCQGRNSGITRIFNPLNGTWRDGPSLEQPRQRALATRLRDGTLLVSGGRNAHHADVYPNGCVLTTSLISSTEQLEPGSDSWEGQANIGIMGDRGHDYSITPFLDGAATIAGRMSLEYYDPNGREWREIPGARRLGDAALVTLDSSRLLAVGGCHGFCSWHRPSSYTADVYDFALGRWLEGGELHTRRLMPTVVRLPDGRVLVVGGNEDGSAEIFVPSDNPANVHIPVSYTR
jgi:hypothetical protein